MVRSFVGYYYRSPTLFHGKVTAAALAAVAAVAEQRIATAADSAAGLLLDGANVVQ